MQKNLCVMVVLVLLALNSTSDVNPVSCTQQVLDKNMGSHVVVESCKNIGVFSVGGLYEGVWEKLTYFYPQPWSGTYITFYVDGKLYSTSDYPRDGVQMDSYLVSKPAPSGNTLSAAWSLPENISVEEKLTVVENGTEIEVTLKNKDSINHKVGTRLHMDTMVGLNDGAPIYIPGDGLMTTEKEYSSSNINFKYWKAYNRQDNPTIVATGYLDPEDGLSYPYKVLIADWKQSKDYAWNYNVTSGKSILGDSAVILYYNIAELKPGEIYSVKTKFGSGSPVLPKEKGAFGITEVTSDNVYGKYCPKNMVNISVDLISSRYNNSGRLSLYVMENEKIIFNQTKPTGVVPEDAYKKILFTWNVPEVGEYKAYDVVVVLTDDYGSELDRATKTSLIKINPSECGSKLKISIALLLFMILLFAILAALVLISLLKKGRVVIKKVVNEKGLVKVTVINNTKHELTNCVVEDGIPQQTELTVSTLNVIRKENKLIWNIGTLPARKNATLEYKIRGANVLPTAKVTWDDGEEISE